MMNAIKSWSKVKKFLVSSVATVLVLTGTVFGYGLVNNNVASVEAASCPTNDIMACGASSDSSFIKKLKANNPSDMDNIYAAYGLPKSQYDEFEKYAKAGRINPDNGNITVSGKTVGYNGQSLGRNAKSVSHKKIINGKTYHESPIKSLTKYFNDAMVLFDSKGNVQTVVMNICGNPIKVTPNNPKYKCDALNVKQVDNDTFQFTSKISASNGASVTKVVYNFGDGTTRTEKSPSTVVTHNYTKTGNFTATVTAYVKTTFGRGEFPITVTADCKKPITVKEAPKPSVNIVKTVDGVETKTVKVGENFVYQLKVTNTGNVTLTNAVVTDQAPANVQFISTDKGTVTGNKLGYTIPSLAAGASVQINITARLTAYVAGTIVNTACVDTPTIPGGPDDCDTANIDTPKPEVMIEKWVNGQERDAVDVNEVFTYTVKVTNNGKVDLINAVVTDPAPAGVTMISTDHGTISGNSLSYTIPRLNIGQSITIAIKAKVTAYKVGDIVNTACVNAVEVNPGNPTQKDDCDDATVTVEKPKVPGVQIDKLVNGKDSVQVNVGETFTYTLKVTNNGQVDLVNAEVRDPAPANVQFLTTDKGVITNNVLTYTVPSLKVGESITISLTAKVTVQVEGSIKNTACVYADEVNPTKPDEADDCDDAWVNVPPVVQTNPNITIVKTVNGVKVTEVGVGEIFTYRLVVRNTGDIDLVNVAVKDNAPAGVTLVGAPVGTIAGDVWSHVISSLKAGESVEFTITAKVVTYQSGSMINTACVNAPEVNPNEPEEDDACDTATVTVPSVPQVLPDTGAGSIIGVFTGVVVVAALGHRFLMRRAFLG